MAFVFEEEEEVKPENGGRFVFEEKETIPKAIGRHVARSAARAAETAIGLPGDIVQLAKTLPGYLPELPSFLEPEHLKKETPIRKGAKKLVEALPTSPELKDFTQQVAGDYLMPQSGGEEFADEVVSDLTSLLIGREIPASGGVVSKTLKTVARPLVASIGANLAKEGAEKLGAGEKTQMFAKLGTMLLIDLTGRKSAKALGKELYADSQKLLPEGADISAKNLSKKLGNLEKRLLKGGTAPSKTPVLTKLKEIKGKIKNGKISVSELQEFKRDLNEVSASLYDLPKDVKGKLKSNFNTLRSDLKSTIGEYGKKNPEFLNTWNKAEEVHAAIQQSQKVRKSIGNVIKKHPHISGAVALGAFGLKMSPTGALVAIPAAASLQSAELVARIMKSPTLRKHYMRTINAAIQENVPAMTKNLSALDKAMKKEGFTFEEED
jgi:hypothetical protein